MTKLTNQRLTEPGCCSLPWWAGDSVRYLDGSANQLASVMSVDMDGNAQKIGDAPPKLVSADGKYEIVWRDGRTIVTRLSDKMAWTFSTGAWPTMSPGSAWILWQYSTADNVPNYAPPSSEIWIARPDGTEPTLLLQKQAGGFYWLDDDRILLVTREDKTNFSDLDIYTISTKTTERLAHIMNLRNLSIAPGGRSLMYYAPFQVNPANSGIYLLESKSGTTPTKMPFFGSWRWRDSNSVIYIPFTPGKPMTFALFDTTNKQSQSLADLSTEPFEIANDDWQVAPDGQAIVFWSATDSALWLAKLAP